MGVDGQSFRFFIKRTSTDIVSASANGDLHDNALAATAQVENREFWVAMTYLKSLFFSSFELVAVVDGGYGLSSKNNEQHH